MFLLVAPESAIDNTLHRHRSSLSNQLLLSGPERHNRTNIFVNGFWRKKKKMSSSKPTLYSYWQSSCAYRVRIALNLKEIRYELQAIDWVSINEFDAVNPMKQVPALRVGKQLLMIYRTNYSFYYLPMI